MKAKFAILAIFLLGMSSCAYKTCPTYAKKSKPATEVVAHEQL